MESLVLYEHVDKSRTHLERWQKSMLLVAKNGRPFPACHSNKTLNLIVKNYLQKTNFFVLISNIDGTDPGSSVQPDLHKSHQSHQSRTP